MTIAVLVKRLPHALGLDLPAYQSLGAAGLDLVAALPPGHTVVLEPGSRDIVPTGLALGLPEGYEAQVRPRSGLALRHGVTVLNAPGTIDADYRGEVQVVLVNHGSEPFAVTRGTRIAQLVLARVARLHWVEGEPEGTARGDRGFGSTGVGACDAPEPGAP